MSSLIIESSGRINMIGEHVDYNGGCVLPGSIDKKIRFKFHKIEGIDCHVKSITLDKEFKFSFKDLSPRKVHWENYIIGAVNYLINKKFLSLSTFSCEISSFLPIGAGISSSSSLICGMVKGLIELNDLNLSNNEIVDIVLDVEHNYIGLKGGIMDQFTILNGKKDHLILLKCQNREFKHIPSNLKNFKILLLNTNVEHNLANTAYNERVNECTEALKIINKNADTNFSFLCEVPEKILNNNKKFLPKTLFSRASFVIKENLRTIKSAEILENNKLSELGNLMYESHFGLSKLYKVSCEELDFLVDLTRNHQKIIGSRMMGGGFGGCTINLIQDDFIGQFVDESCKAYYEKFGKEATPILAELDNGITIKKT